MNIPIELSEMGKQFIATDGPKNQSKKTQTQIYTQTNQTNKNQEESNLQKFNPQTCETYQKTLSKTHKITKLDKNLCQSQLLSTNILPSKKSFQYNKKMNLKIFNFKMILIIDRWQISLIGQFLQKCQFKASFEKFKNQSNHFCGIEEQEQYEQYEQYEQERENTSRNSSFYKYNQKLSHNFFTSNGSNKDVQTQNSSLNTMKFEKNISQIDDFDKMLEFCQEAVKNSEKLKINSKDLHRHPFFYQCLQTYFGQKKKRILPINKGLIIQMPSKIKFFQAITTKVKQTPDKEKDKDNSCQNKNNQNKIQQQQQHDFSKNNLKNTNTNILLSDKLGNIYFVQNGQIKAKNKKRSKKTSENNSKNKKILALIWMNKDYFVMIQNNSLVKICNKLTLDDDGRYQVVSISNKKIDFALIEVQKPQINIYKRQQKLEQNSNNMRPNRNASVIQKQQQNLTQTTIYINILCQVQKQNTLIYTTIKYDQYQQCGFIQKRDIGIINQISVKISQKFSELFFFRIRRQQKMDNTYIQQVEEEQIQKILVPDFLQGYNFEDLQQIFYCQKDQYNSQTLAKRFDLKKDQKLLGISQNYKQIRIIQSQNKVGNLFQVKDNQYINKIKIMNEKVQPSSNNNKYKKNINQGQKNNVDDFCNMGNEYEYEYKGFIQRKDKDIYKDYIYAFVTTLDYNPKNGQNQKSNKVIQRNILKINFYGDILQTFPIHCNILSNLVQEGLRRKNGKVKTTLSEEEGEASSKNQLKVQDFFICNKEETIVICTKQNIVYYSMTNKTVLFTLQTEQITNISMTKIIKLDQNLQNLGYLKGQFFEIISIEQKPVKKILIEKRAESILGIRLNRIPRNFLVLMRQIGRNHPQIFQLNIF